MPLHDWTEAPGWHGVHQIWRVELLYWVKPRLPAGYRAYIGTTPAFAIGAPPQERPDVGVQKIQGKNHADSDTVKTSAGANDASEEPDQEIAVSTIEGDSTLFVERKDRLVAAIELVSPRNKDRPSACAAYASGYVG